MRKFLSKKNMNFLSKKNMNCLFKLLCLLLILYLLYSVLKPILTETFNNDNPTAVYPTCSDASGGYHQLQCVDGTETYNLFNGDNLYTVKVTGVNEDESKIECNGKAETGQYGICGYKGPKGDTGSIPNPYKLDCSCQNLEQSS